MNINDAMKVLTEAAEDFYKRAQTGRRELPRGFEVHPHADNPAWTFVMGPCAVTGKIYVVSVQLEDLEKFQAQTKAQDAFPYLDAGDREFLISGTSPEGYLEVFGPPPEAE